MACGSPEQSENFLQSLLWMKFQEKVGHKIHSVVSDGFSANAVEHILPIVGKYFYLPRGPIFSHPLKQAKDDMVELIGLAKKEDAGWVRIEPADGKTLESIKESISQRITRAPHDMQPKEIFVIDISKPEDALLGEMKPKTRYNVNLAKKKGVVIKSSRDANKNGKDKYVEEFLRLTQEMAVRNGIRAHAQDYYRQMIESFPDENLAIYVAEYDGKIIAANLVVFFDGCAVYLHGASGNEQRNVMAPFLLQWQAILDAKELGCRYYDFGGVQTPGAKHQKHSSLVGVTNFKLGFSPSTQAIEFPGSYDIILNPRKYAVYRGLQRAKYLLAKIRR